MKISIERQEVETSGVTQSSTFQIKASGHAFKILSNSLYSDKISAIIRELSANAADSHVAAGKKDVPITIHLPTNREPWFAVTDQGTGLSHEDVLSLYTTYFSSSKSDSNDFIGAFGLGSKSPFAYTNSFSISSIKDGVKKVYSAFVSEEFVPQINTMHEEVTTEGNGITVTVPVKASDINDFNSKAKDVCKFFNPYPKGIPAADKVTYDYDDGVLRIRGANADPYAYSYTSRQSFIVQGMVGYKLNKGELNTLPHTLQTMLGRLNVDLIVPMGSIEVAASREDVSYTEKTVKHLVELMTKHLTMFKDSVVKTFNDTKTRAEAVDWMIKNASLLDIVGTPNHPIFGRMSKAAPLSDIFNIVGDKNDDVAAMELFYRSGSRWSHVSEHTDALTKQVSRWDLLNSNLRLSSKVGLYWIDDKKFWKAKMANAMESDKVAIVGNAKQIKQIEDYIGIKVKKLSDMTYNRVVTKQNTNRVIAVDVTSHNRIAYGQEIRTEADLIGDAKTPVYYAILRHSTVLFTDSKGAEMEVGERNFHSIKTNFIGRNINTTYRVVLVRQSGKLMIPKNWISIEDTFKSEMLASKPKYLPGSHGMGDSLIKELIKNKKSITNKDALEVLDILIDLKNNDRSKKVVEHTMYEKLTGVNLLTGIPDVWSVVEAFEKKYPLLTGVDHYSISKELLTHILKYINIMA